MTTSPQPTETKKAEEPKLSLLPPIITASERLAKHRGIKGLILGEFGIGKTTLLKTLDASRTLFIDLEAGSLAIGELDVKTAYLKTWEHCRHFATLIGGPDCNQKKESPYSAEIYAQLKKDYGALYDVDQYDTIFIDSITVASRWCRKWCEQQPDVVAKSGEENNWKKFDLIGQEMMTWVNHFQRIPNKNIWFVGLLESKFNSNNEPIHQLQCEGDKLKRELPGIVDIILTYAFVDGLKTTEPDKGTPIKYRAFICKKNNFWHYPAKDRSGKLSVQEPNHLGNLMKKILSPSNPQPLIQELPTDVEFK
ncbi:hypothetical protein Cva_01655 [Caedimonas varicaedens]|uniref:Uncharacterized protein n=1 Tax=Caedimonas varicaedens TaxID=1629334 RepID=A0A0K8MEP5_9PROT|nr:hypothetical protein Cva_01655 [Caedimonas varicaedens]